MSTKITSALFRFLPGKALFVIIPVCICCFQFCRKDPLPMDESCGYTTPIGQLVLGKCATPGCHTTASSSECAGLDLSTWENLFKGGKNNSSVIPFRPDQSYLLFSVNTFHHFGPQLLPTMPLNHPPLSHDEVSLIRNWIASGAPNNQGEIKFSGDANRSKIYVANQGCDVVTVFDAKTKLVMRCITVGRTSTTESPHDIMVSPDGLYWYVTFYMGSYIQKYSTADDQLVAELDLGSPSWHSMCISDDSKSGVFSQWNSQGKVAYVDLETMTLRKMYLGLYSYPHGCAFDPTGNYFYVVSQMGNFVYKTDLSDLVSVDYEMITMETGGVPQFGGVEKPYVIKFSPDNSKYFITCQGTNDVRVFNSVNDSLLEIIHTSGVPQLIEFSKNTPYAFVSCMIDTTNSLTESSVDVINWQTNTYVKTLFPGFQERGLAVDDANGVVYVGNRNVDAGGPAPHHTTACQGKNGDIALISIATLEVIPGWKTEVSSDPYCITIRP
ncbi:MAG: YncE family protein [Bacteroidota bacterium]|nr:YncE family protein [Bacteroidota bacterium]